MLYIRVYGTVVVTRQYRDCNTGISNPGIGLAFFANPESRDWWRSNPGISKLQKLVKIVLFCMLNDTNNNFSRLISKIFHVR